MKLVQETIKGIRFYHRPGFSDLKTFQEVIGDEAYLKRGLKIGAGEKWMDCGGNVGAFALLACKLGAEVTVYEPDPYNVDMIKRNLRLNGFTATVKQAALIHDDRRSAILYIPKNGNVWRNSIIRKFKFNNQGIKVPCLNFDDEAKDFDCCKMDIEGAEMPILENTDVTFKKLVYEWSFDIDPSLARLWAVIDKQKQDYRIEAGWHTICYDDHRETLWQHNWFPRCTNVFCFSK